MIAFVRKKNKNINTYQFSIRKQKNLTFLFFHGKPVPNNCNKDV